MRSWLWLLAPAVIGALVVWFVAALVVEAIERATSVEDVRRRLAPYKVDQAEAWLQRMRRV
jgi:putative effector of murein hydrolase LrgA (UPF0299 family)